VLDAEHFGDRGLHGLCSPVQAWCLRGKQAELRAAFKPAFDKAAARLSAP